MTYFVCPVERRTLTHVTLLALILILLLSAEARSEPKLVRWRRAHRVTGIETKTDGTTCSSLPSHEKKTTVLKAVVCMYNYWWLRVMCVVIKSPPYEVTECGYGSFECRIDVYFRNKGDPRKLTFMHDLVLTLDKTPDPVVAARYEKLTFRSPSEEFAQRLLRAGGVSSLFCYLLTLLIVYPSDSSCFSNSYPYCFLKLIFSLV